MVPAIAYARYSSELQDDMSIVSQMEEIRRWAGINGYDIIDEYIDSAQAGSSERDGLSRIKRAVKDRNCSFKAVIAWKSNRIYRDANKAGLFEDVLERKGIKLLYVAESNMPGPQGRMVRKIINSMNEYYVEDLGIEVLSKSKTWTSQGYAPGGTPPFGYEKYSIKIDIGGKTLEKKKYRPSLDARWVVYIYEEYAKGRGIHKIAFSLNDKGIKTPRGGKWHSSQIHNVLFANQHVYLGGITYNKYSREKPPADSDRKRSKMPKHLKDKSEWVVAYNCHEAIISEELAYAVNEVRDNRPPSLNVNKKRGRKIHLLTGLCKCYSCGHTFLIGQGSSNTYYTCGGRRTRGLRVDKVECDNNIWLPQDKLEHAVRGIFTRRLSSRQLRSELDQAIHLHHKKQDGALESKKGALERDLAEYKRKRDNVLDAIADGTIGRDMAKERIGGYQSRIENVEIEMATLSHHDEFDLSFVENLKGKWYNDSTVVRALMVATIKEITMYPTECVIHYKFPLHEDRIQYRNW